MPASGPLVGEAHVVVEVGAGGGGGEVGGAGAAHVVVEVGAGGGGGGEGGGAGASPWTTRKME